jgi:hypothetical protein
MIFVFCDMLGKIFLLIGNDILQTPNIHVGAAQQPTSQKAPAEYQPLSLGRDRVHSGKLSTSAGTALTSKQTVPMTQVAVPLPIRCEKNDHLKRKALTKLYQLTHWRICIMNLCKK